MRKRRGRAARTRALAASAAVVAAAGCGVRPTGVLSAGSMPVADGRASTITVYLVNDHALYPAVRPGLPGHPYLALAQLGVPVTSQERRMGLYTDVPPQEISVSQGGPPGMLTVWVDDPGPQGLRPGPGSRWPRLALAQVACTAQAIPGVKRVLLEAPDDESGHDRVSLVCADFADLR
jgi:hypothetical protein